MNIFTRLAFVSLSAIILYIFGAAVSSAKELSDGQQLVLSSPLPASLMLLTAAFYTKKYANEVVALMLMFAGVFFAMLCYGMYKLTGELPYSAFTWIGIALCATSVGAMTLDSIRPQARPAQI